MSFARREFELTPQPLLTVLVVTAVQVTYTLMAVLLHLGVAVDTGHYVTIVKQPADWLVCDDLNSTINFIKEIYFYHQ